MKKMCPHGCKGGVRDKITANVSWCVLEKRKRRAGGCPGCVQIVCTFCVSNIKHQPALSFFLSVLSKMWRRQIGTYSRWQVYNINWNYFKFFYFFVAHKKTEFNYKFTVQMPEEARSRWISLTRDEMSTGWYKRPLKKFQPAWISRKNAQVFFRTWHQAKCEVLWCIKKIYKRIICVKSTTHLQNTWRKEMC